MMDLKEIIKWFIPCFHILRTSEVKLNARLTCICLFLLVNFRLGMTAKMYSLDANQFNTTKNLELSNNFYTIRSDESDLISNVSENGRSLATSYIGKEYFYVKYVCSAFCLYQ